MWDLIQLIWPVLDLFLCCCLFGCSTVVVLCGRVDKVFYEFTRWLIYRFIDWLIECYVMPFERWRMSVCMHHTEVESGKVVSTKMNRAYVLMSTIWLFTVFFSMQVNEWMNRIRSTEKNWLNKISHGKYYESVNFAHVNSQSQIKWISKRIFAEHWLLFGDGVCLEIVHWGARTQKYAKID